MAGAGPAGPGRAAARRLPWRWGVVLLGLAVLVGLPSAVSALPAHGTDRSAAALLERVRASGAVGWSGTAESRGSLALPDTSDLGDLPALLGSTVRTRTWWRSPTSYRVDQQQLTGERDVVVDGAVTSTWDSGGRTDDQLVGALPVRLPRADDLVAPMLGRRLAGASDAVLARLPARRVAGRSADGLRLTPRDPRSSTVASVDLWADTATGLPLEVEVRAVGEPAPVLTSLLLDLDLRAPARERTLFDVPPDAQVTTGRAPDIAAQVDAAVPYVLPQQLAGQQRQVVGGLEQARGVGTYGAGLASFAVVPLPRDVAGRLARRLALTGSQRVSTPLLTGLLGTSGRRSYLLVGSVPASVLDAAFAELQRTPPPRRRG